MKGLLVVNNFIDSNKFSEIYSMLLGSAQKLGISLEMKRTGELLHNMRALGSVKSDFILFWDKDVLLAKMLEECGNRVFNSSDAIFACDNKAYTYLELSKRGIATPDTVVAPLTFEETGYSNTAFADEAAEMLGYPLVVKELYGSFGGQVYLAHDREELMALISRMGHKGFLMQEFIKESAGRDVRINVVGGMAVSSMLRYSVSGDFRSNITNGGKMQRYEAREQQKRVATEACRALGLDFAGVDILFGSDGEPIVCEVNSNPHFKSSIECTGVDMSALILAHIKDKVEDQ